MSEAMVISPTLLATWKNCPQSALVRVRDKKYTPTGRKGFVGSLVHAAIASVLNNGQPEDWHQHAKELIGEGWQLNRGMSEAKITPRILTNIINKEVIPAAEAVERLGYEGANTEIRIDAPYKEHALRGIVDAEVVGESGSVLIDWKTGRLYEDTVRDQLLFYVWLWSLDRGVEVGQVRAVNVGDGEVLSFDPPWDVESIRSDVDRLIVDLVGSWDSEADRFPGFHCRWCPIADECPRAEGR